METLLSAFERRTNSVEGMKLVGNAAKIAVAHASVGYTSDPRFEAQAQALAITMSGVGGGGREVDRSPKTLASYHELEVDMLVSFAAGGRVVDLGAGRSSLLDEFSGRSQTIAADINSKHLVFQQHNGHQPLDVSETGTEIPLESNSVRLLHASYSVPYWSASPRDAVSSAAEVMRVLEPGGIALVGSTTGRYEQRTYEDMLVQSRNDDDAHLPQQSAADQFDTHTRNGFITATVVALAKGAIEVVGTRYPQPTLPTADPTYHYPNFLIIRKS